MFCKLYAVSMRFYSFSAKFSRRSRFDRAARDICQSRAPFSGRAAFPSRIFSFCPARMLSHAILLPQTGDRCASGIFRAAFFLRNRCLCASQAQPYSVEANSRSQSPARRNTSAASLYRGYASTPLYPPQTNPYLPPNARNRSGPASRSLLTSRAPPSPPDSDRKILSIPPRISPRPII